MFFDKNPATLELHAFVIKRINEEFQYINFPSNTNYLSIVNYINESPEKFYSKEIYKKYFDFFEKHKIQEPKVLADILIDIEPQLNISNRTLIDINKKNIHDIILPEEQNDLINFIDKEVHFNLLKIFETAFYNFLLIIAKFSRISRGKNTDGLDLYNVVEEIKNTEFDFVSNVFNNTIRNGIAHGKVIFTDLDIIYADKKGNKEQIRIKKIIKIFDTLIDFTNAFCLALKVFYFSNPKFLETYKIRIPKSILIEELQAKSNAPAWKITNCLDSVALNDKNQLIIYINNDNWDFNKVQWYCFSTAYWAERLTKSYDRIFFSLNSSHSLNGWAGFDGNRLKELREQNATQIESYTGVLENNMIFFVPKIKFPRLIYKIGTFISIIKVTLPIYWKKYINTHFPNPFIVRDSQIHSKGKFLVVSDTSVIIKPAFQKDIENLIRDTHKKIVRLAKKYSKKKYSWFSYKRHLPVKYIRVIIYDTDKRLRGLRNSGLIEDLIATIEVNTSKQIKTIDIFNGTLEQHGKYRIVWHQNWKGN